MRLLRPRRRRPRRRSGARGSGAGRPSLRRLAPLLPAVVLLLLFFAGPVLWSFYTAFTNQSLSGAGASTPHFIGLDNFTRMWSRPDLRQVAAC